MTLVLLNSKEDCCGCRACANACPKDAIRFKVDEYGYYYPVINEKLCVGCNNCLKTCDFQQKNVDGHMPLRGYAARHKDPAVYGSSTSGGTFTALAQYVLEKKGVVFGCVFGDDMVPKHVAAESLENIAAMRGSKYVQSDTGLIYREVKDNLTAGRWVLFTGTPCQVAALYSFLGNTDKTQLLTVDIICHGVPSPGVFSKYIDFLTRKYGRRVTNFQFRNKRYEWERPVIKVSFEKGKDKWWFTTEDVYYENFNKGNFHRPSCFNCKYACLKRYGDVTIGDFWGYQKANLKMSKKEGISCCLLNSAKAVEIFKGLPIQAEEVDIATIIQGNTRLRKHETKTNNWETVMNNIRDNGFGPLAKSFNRTHRKVFLKSFIKKLVLRPLNSK
jgi:coenzyme F420-reducing hydrogenase beta subunit